MKLDRRNKTRKGGAATAFPLKYFNPDAETPDASSGRDLLHASGMGIRPKIGGRRRKTRRTRGGFVPSVMGGFLSSASKYIAPLALFVGYKLLTRKGKKGRKSVSRRK
jgi:hypothetical protein